MPSTHFRRGDNQAALLELRRRVAGGQEFPDACADVALEHRVDHDALRDAYDAACLSLLHDVLAEGVAS